MDSGTHEVAVGRMNLLVDFLCRVGWGMALGLVLTPAADVPGEIGHAQQLAHRIKQLGGHVPGSQLAVDVRAAPGGSGGGAYYVATAGCDTRSVCSKAGADAYLWKVTL